MDRMEFKKQVVEECLVIVKAKITELDKESESLRISSESETKSSMGDKYETIREMIMQERGKLVNQRALMVKQVSFLNATNLEKRSQVVEFGTLVDSEVSTYFICTAVGKIQLSGKDVFVISANSPIAQQMLGKKIGDQITFNTQSFTIKSLV